jgi:peptidoglycan hydrolase CwlO-like protein
MSKKYVYIIIGVFALIVIAFLLFPSVPKGFLKDLIKTYEVEYKQKQKELDSIQNLRVRDSIDYLDALSVKESELMEIQQRLERANHKIRQNEKELNSYRNGDFNERFGKFTRLITVTDSL